MRKKSSTYLNDFLWEEGIQAVKDSLNFTSFQEFHDYLCASLPPNSIETRKRYATDVIRWFFPTHRVDGLLSAVWCHYQDEALLKDLMRYQYLSVTPLVSQFVVEFLIPAEPGMVVQLVTFNEYIRAKRGSSNDRVEKRLLHTVGQLGFIQRNKDTITIAQIPPPRTALFLLIHDLFAATPQVVTLDNILRNSFWKYLGFRNEDEVRNILKNMASNEHFSKYVVADQLEQITTKYPLKEILERKIHA